MARPIAIALSAFALATLAPAEIAIPCDVLVLVNLPVASTCPTLPVTAKDAKIPATTIFFLPVVFLAISETTT